MLDVIIKKTIHSAINFIFFKGAPGRLLTRKDRNALAIKHPIPPQKANAYNPAILRTSFIIRKSINYSRVKNITLIYQIR